MKTRYWLTLTAATAIACFAWGVATMHYRVFPYSLLRQAKHSASGGHGGYWHNRVSVLKTSPPADVIMLGDSHTDIAEWPGAANHGISGDTTKGILDRLDVVLSKNPRTAFVLAGLNDLEQGASADEVIHRLLEIGFELKQGGVETVVIQSVLPPSAVSLREHLPAIAEINAALEKSAGGGGMIFLDLRPALCRDGVLRREYTIDGIHLNGAGCTEWAKAVQEYQ